MYMYTELKIGLLSKKGYVYVKFSFIISVSILCFGPLTLEWNHFQMSDLCRNDTYMYLVIY